MSSQKIKILPENLTNKIAAGEVVQRPESVLKELLENAIDANADNIEVIIKRAGKSLIQVVDDGNGMTEEDVKLCIQRHATSKISSIEDLEAISTFGFRGEALSSIAAVSQFEIKTETGEEEIGSLLKNSDGQELVFEKGSFAKGTSVTVKNLFYNTPARRNFLKSNATELKHLIDTFKKISVSHPNMSFKFWNDDDLIFDYQKGSLEQRIKDIFAENMLDAIIEVEEVTDYIGIKGYVAKPTFLSKSRSEQYLFINNRFVISKLVSHAVFSAYENILEKGQYPFYLLFLTIDPSRIDVNVHPTKLEVKFDDEKTIYSIVNVVVKKCLGSFDLVPSMTFDPETEEKERLRFNKFRKTDKQDFSDRPNFVNSFKNKQQNQNAYSDEDIDLLFGTINREIKQNSQGDNIPHPFDNSNPTEVYHDHNETVKKNNTSHDSAFIVSLHNKYILTQIKTGLMIIDAHVAHERILYEKALKSLNANLPFSQQLLFSQTLDVDAGDYALLKELDTHLIKLGFELKFFSKNTVSIIGVPPDIKIGSEVDTLMDILEEYKKNQREKGLEVRDNLAKSYSCKAAIKAGDSLSEQELRLLVDQLFATSMPYVCPHGRPIVIKIPLDEFDKRFGRT